jgi:hypothetical protein
LVRQILLNDDTKLAERISVDIIDQVIARKSTKSVKKDVNENTSIRVYHWAGTAPGQIHSSHKVMVSESSVPIFQKKEESSVPPPVQLRCPFILGTFPPTADATNAP